MQFSDHEVYLKYCVTAYNCMKQKGQKYVYLFLFTKQNIIDLYFFV